MKRNIVIAITAILLVAASIGIIIFWKDRDVSNLGKETASNFAEQNLEVVSFPSSAPQPIIQDTDGDRLSDEDERRYGTDPAKPDTDGDGLSDWYEVDIYGTDPLKIDTDGDSFSDSQEVRAGYDPRSKEPRQLP